jgi:hypothetical protein
MNIKYKLKYMKYQNINLFDIFKNRGVRKWMKNK